MNDWMDTHLFQEGVKFQRFCLTLVGEARLWYESLRSINVDCKGLQNQFRQRYPKEEMVENSYFTCGNHFISVKIQKP